jgi:hypothetical protein
MLYPTSKASKSSAFVSGKEIKAHCSRCTGFSYRLMISQSPSQEVLRRESSLLGGRLKLMDNVTLFTAQIYILCNLQVLHCGLFDTN